MSNHNYYLSIIRSRNYEPPLDLYPGAVAAYSVRKLRKNYSGPCMRVRRSLDSAEQDIGFDANGDLDIIGLKTFVDGGTDGWVTTWYDQSGNGVHQARIIASQQPQIVGAGIVLNDNNKPSLYFYNGSQSMRSVINVSLTSSQGEWSSFGVSRNLDFSISRVIFSYDGIVGDFVTPRIGQFMRVAPSGACQAIGFRSDYTSTNDSGPIVGSNQAILNSIRRVNNIEMFANGVSNGASSLVGVAQTGITPLDIGYRGGIDFSVFQPLGYIQELIHYPLDSTNFYQEMVKNINSYYKAF